MAIKRLHVIDYGKAALSIRDHEQVKRTKTIRALVKFMRDQVCQMKCMNPPRNLLA